MDDSPVSVAGVPDLSDTALLEAWSASDWMPGDPLADALAVEIERRGLDV